MESYKFYSYDDLSRMLTEAYEEGFNSANSDSPVKDPSIYVDKVLSEEIDSTPCKKLITVYNQNFQVEHVSIYEGTTDELHEMIITDYDFDLDHKNLLHVPNNGGLLGFEYISESMAIRITDVPETISELLNTVYNIPNI